MVNDVGFKVGISQQSQQRPGDHGAAWTLNESTLKQRSDPFPHGWAIVFSSSILLRLSHIIYLNVGTSNPTVPGPIRFYFILQPPLWSLWTGPNAFALDHKPEPPPKAEITNAEHIYRPHAANGRWSSKFAGTALQQYFSWQKKLVALYCVVMTLQQLKHWERDEV